MKTIEEMKKGKIELELKLIELVSQFEKKFDNEIIYLHYSILLQMKLSNLT